MNETNINQQGATPATSRTAQLFTEHQQAIYKSTDRMFAVLMTLQWIAGVVAAYLISPRTWIGSTSQTHIHIWAALILGAAISSLPILLALTRPGFRSTRYTIAVGQMLMGALLIHLTGGRIETHFHVFGSLAFLSFYRDWRVLIPATVVVAADHFLRGLLWPQSVYGVLAASEWRWLEHAGWVLFENTFLLIAIKRSVSEMWDIAARRAQSEDSREDLESHVAQRTAQLAAANQELETEVAERKSAENALRDSEGRYRLLFESNPLPMWVYDLETLAFLAVNEAAERRYGFSSAEFLRMSIADIRLPEDAPQLLSSLSSGSSGLSEGSTWRHRTKDGTVIDVEITAYPLTFTGRHAELVLANDITERKQAEEALRRSESQLRQALKMEAVGKLAGGIAHDFNNLLTAITGQSEMCLRRLTPDDPIYGRIDEIKKAGDRAAVLTRQLLAFSRKQILQPEVIDLNHVVFEVSKMLQRLIGEDIDLLMGLGADLGRVKADPNQLEQVLMNLTVNARDAMPKGGKLTIETSNMQLSEAFAGRHLSVPPGDYVMLAVSDTGCGMDATTQARIFEPFFTTKEVGKGTGLGLATVYGIVKQSGGSLWVYSEVGQGTTFKIYLPCVEGPVEKVKVSAKHGELAAGVETVLLVEDDVVMPRMSGRELAEQLGNLPAGSESAVHVRLYRRRDRASWSAGRRHRLHRQAIHYGRSG